MGNVYMCIDLKSFYASVECIARGYDPFKVPLVVADPTRGDGAITLAMRKTVQLFRCNNLQSADQLIPCLLHTLCLLSYY